VNGPRADGTPMMRGCYRRGRWRCFTHSNRARKTRTL
jgi:hypothetical protein